MGFDNFGNEPKFHIGSDFTINQYENASANYQKIDDLRATQATATFLFKSTSPAEYADGVIGIRSAASTLIAYQFENGGGNSTGDNNGSAIVVQISGLSTTATIARELQTAINSANGHNGGSVNSIISMVVNSDTQSQLILTQVTKGTSGNTGITQADVLFSVLEVPSDFSGGSKGPPFDGQVPFSLGLSGVLPFNIGSVASKSAYTMTKGKQISTE